MAKKIFLGHRTPWTLNVKDFDQIIGHQYTPQACLKASRKQL